MRRTFAIGCIAALLLPACNRIQVQVLPFEEVLQLAEQASRDLQSVRYDAEGDATVGSQVTGMTRGTFAVKGVLQDGGKQTALTVSFSTTTDTAAAGRSTLAGTLDVVYGGPDALFFRMRDGSTTGESPLVRAEALGSIADVWWRLPSDESLVASASISPDPALLRAQLEGIDVLHEYGIRTIRGRPAYHYDIGLNTEKFLIYLQELALERSTPFDERSTREAIESLDAQGDVWIDAETFQTHSLTWRIAMPSSSDSSTVITFSIDFFDHNAAESITLPSDAQEFHQFQFLDGVVAPGNSTLSEEEQQQILKQLLQQGPPTRP